MPNTPYISKAHNFKDISGVRFGNLLAVSPINNKQWLCLCDCGNFTKVFKSNLSRLHTISCGCYRHDQRIHGYSSKYHSHPIYACWMGMKARCYNKNVKEFRFYGARGITVCERWLASFVNFLEDVGKGWQKGLSLDRIDNNGNYEPSNCRWATRSQQMNNRRGNLVIEFNGVKMTARQWDIKLGFRMNTISGRIHKGWSHERAVSTPVKKCHR